MSITMTKRPVEYTPKKACKCHDCGNRIDGYTTAARVNGRVVCGSCASGYEWSETQQKWIRK